MSSSSKFVSIQFHRKSKDEIYFHDNEVFKRVKMKSNYLWLYLVIGVSLLSSVHV